MFFSISKHIKEGENLHVVVDSTGIKVFGEGEWKVRQHGYSKRRTWRKLHVAINEKGEIEAVEVTKNDVHDADALLPLLDQIPSGIDTLSGDGAFDKRKVYDYGVARGITSFLIPPQKNARIVKHGNRKGYPSSSG